MQPGDTSTSGTAQKPCRRVHEVRCTLGCMKYSIALLYGTHLDTDYSCVVVYYVHTDVQLTKNAPGPSILANNAGQYDRTTVHAG